MLNVADVLTLADLLLGTVFFLATIMCPSLQNASQLSLVEHRLNIMVLLMLFQTGEGGGRILVDYIYGLYVSLGDIHLSIFDYMLVIYHHNMWLYSIVFVSIYRVLIINKQINRFMIS